MNTTATLLDGIDRLLGRFVAFPSDHDRHAVAGWVLHCWVVEAFDSTPRLALLSPEKGSGKTRTLEVLELVVPNPHHSVNMSVSVMFRLVGDPNNGTVTLLMDEADTYLGWKVARDNEDIRGMVNAGHRRGATVYRMRMEGGAAVERYPAFAPVALAGIGDLPDTIIDRSIVISMRRRAPAEQVDPYRRRKVEPGVAGLRDGIEAWSADVDQILSDSVDELVMPDGIIDRAADVWEPLVAIGDLAGDPWSSRIRQAAVVLNGQRQERDPSLGMQLLRDIRLLFDERGADRISSSDLAAALADIEGAPWADIRGNPIDMQGVAKRLRPYKVRPHPVRFGPAEGDVAKGYQREDFHDLWTRYLPPDISPHAGHNGYAGHNDGTNADSVTEVTEVTAVGEARGGAEAGCTACHARPVVAFGLDGRPWCAGHNPHVGRAEQMPL